MDVQSCSEVQEPYGNCDGFNENTFTFHVGSPKKPFVVHADVVSPHSKVLGRLIEGQFKEGIERYAELPEVDPVTFEHFLAYAYFTSKYPPGTEGTTKTLSAPRTATSTSKLIELLLTKEHKKFQCKSCSDPTELKFSLSFPLCGKCNQDEFNSLRWGPHCIVLGCSKNGGYIHGLCCEGCLRALRVLSYGRLADGGASKLQLNLPEALEGLQDFHFHNPLRVEDILEATKDLIAPPLSATASLLDIARLAVFADIYQVKPLSQSALMALYWRLTHEELDEESITTICELTDHVYSNTPNRATPQVTSVEGGGAHVLRRILSQFIATYRSEFTSSPTFMQLLLQGGELAGDILLATTRCGV